MSEDPKAEPEPVSVSESEPGSESESESVSVSDSDSEPEPESVAAKPLPGAGTPAGAELARANAAFDAGNYQLVREISGKLAEASDDEVARAARELHARTDVDPVQIGVLLACLALFGVIVYMYVL